MKSTLFSPLKAMCRYDSKNVMLLVCHFHYSRYSYGNIIPNPRELAKAGGVWYARNMENKNLSLNMAMMLKSQTIRNLKSLLKYHPTSMMLIKNILKKYLSNNAMIKISIMPDSPPSNQKNYILKKYFQF